MKMVGEEHLPDDFAMDLKRYKHRGSSGKVNLALSGLPDLQRSLGPDRISGAPFPSQPSVDYMERAYDEAGDGRYSRQPLPISGSQV